MSAENCIEWAKTTRKIIIMTQWCLLVCLMPIYTDFSAAIPWINGVFWCVYKLIFRFAWDFFLFHHLFLHFNFRSSNFWYVCFFYIVVGCDAVVVVRIANIYSKQKKTKKYIQCFVMFNGRNERTEHLRRTLFWWRIVMR